MDIQGNSSDFTQISPYNISQPAKTENNLKELSPEEKDKISKLKERDQEVRRHEQAHLSAGGGLTKGGARYEYETGPNGRQYAVEGSVDIDTTKDPAGPEATITKAKKIQASALAPDDPSGQDRSVAAKARRMEQEAQREIQKAQQEETKLYNNSGRQDNLLGLQSTISLFA